MRRYLIVVEKADGNYSAYSPDLPGCVAIGETAAEAGRNMREAIEMHIQDCSKTTCPSPSLSPAPSMSRFNRAEEGHCGTPFAPGDYVNLAIIAGREDEETISFDEMKQRLREDGLL